MNKKLLSFQNFFKTNLFKITFTITWILISLAIFEYEVSRSIGCFMSLGCNPSTVAAILSLFIPIFLLPVLILKEVVSSMLLLLLSQVIYSYFISVILDKLLPKSIKKIISIVCCVLIAIALALVIYQLVSRAIQYKHRIQEISSTFYSKTGKKAEDLFIIKSYGKTISQIQFTPHDTYISYYVIYYDPITGAPSGDVNIMSPKIPGDESVEKLFSWYTSLNTQGYYQNKEVMIENNAVILQTAGGEEWRFTWKTDQYVVSIMGLNRTVVKDYLKKYPSKIESN